jgi:cytochrome P450
MAETKDARSKADVTMEFDHHIPIAEQDPDDKVDELRGKCPIGWSNQAGGFWYMTRYDDVRSALVEWNTFCSENGGTSVPGYAIEPSIPLDLNPPEHKPYRQLLNPMLSREEVADKLQPRVEYWTDHFIDQVIGLGSCDLVHDVAIKVPGAVTLEWLGWGRVGSSRQSRRGHL